MAAGGFMVRRLAWCALLVGMAASVTAGGPADGPRTIDKTGSKIEFRAKATFAKADGVFREWDAELRMPGDTLEGASLRLKLNTESVTTGNGTKDKEIKSKNFFDVKVFPDIQFISTKVSPGPDAFKFVMDGDMTLRGITKPVTLTILAHPVAAGHQLIEGQIAFNRRDFGMTHNVPFNKVADEVEVEIRLNVVSGATAAEGAPETGE